MTEDPGLQLLIYTTEPASASEDRIRLLGSWAADQPWAERYGQASALARRNTSRA